MKTKEEKRAEKAAYDKLYYAKTKEVRYEYQKKWRKENKEKFLETVYLRYQVPEGRLKKLVNSIKTRSKTKKLDCDITSEWLLEKWNSTKGCCEITGIPFELRSKNNANPFSPSIDREDNSKGYTKDNCKLVIWAYNAAKGTGTHEQVLYFCEQVVNKNVR